MFNLTFTLTVTLTRILTLTLTFLRRESPQFKELCVTYNVPPHISIIMVFAISCNSAWMYDNYTYSCAPFVHPSVIRALKGSELPMDGDVLADHYQLGEMGEITDCGDVEIVDHRGKLSVGEAKESYRLETRRIRDGEYMTKRQMEQVNRSKTEEDDEERENNERRRCVKSSGALKRKPRAKEQKDRRQYRKRKLDPTVTCDSTLTTNNIIASKSTTSDIVGSDNSNIDDDDDSNSSKNDLKEKNRARMKAVWKKKLLLEEGYKEGKEGKEGKNDKISSDSNGNVLSWIVADLNSNPNSNPSSSSNPNFKPNSNLTANQSEESDSSDSYYSDSDNSINSPMVAAIKGSLVPTIAPVVERSDGLELLIEQTEQIDPTIDPTVETSAGSTDSIPKSTSENSIFLSATSSSQSHAMLPSNGSIDGDGLLMTKNTDPAMVVDSPGFKPYWSEDVGFGASGDEGMNLSVSHDASDKNEISGNNVAAESKDIGIENNGVCDIVVSSNSVSANNTDDNDNDVIDENGDVDNDNNADDNSVDFNDLQEEDNGPMVIEIDQSNQGGDVKKQKNIEIKESPEDSNSDNNESSRKRSKHDHNNSIPSLDSKDKKKGTKIGGKKGFLSTENKQHGCQGSQKPELKNGSAKSKIVQRSDIVDLTLDDSQGPGLDDEDEEDDDEDEDKNEEEEKWIHNHVKRIENDKRKAPKRSDGADFFEPKKTSSNSKSLSNSSHKRLMKNKRDSISDSSDSGTEDWGDDNDDNKKEDKKESKCKDSKGKDSKGKGKDRLVLELELGLGLRLGLEIELELWLGNLKFFHDRFGSLTQKLIVTLTLTLTLIPNLNPNIRLFDDSERKPNILEDKINAQWEKSQGAFAERSDRSTPFNKPWTAGKKPLAKVNSLTLILTLTLTLTLTL
jgi:hypothetical protein